MTTTTVTASEMAEVIFAEADVLLAKLDGQVLVSQSRWVDNLLDLYNLVDTSPLKDVIARTLSDIRHLGSVEGSWLRAIADHRRRCRGRNSVRCRSAASLLNSEAAGGSSMGDTRCRAPSVALRVKSACGRSTVF